MKKFFKTLGIFVAILVVLLGVWIFHNSVYPFTTSHPNFSDVERVFNKMQFPSSWQEIDSSENRGVAGRLCPIESSTKCYHKSKTFSIPEATTIEDVKKVLLQTGCPIIGVRDNTAKNDMTKKYSLVCSIDALDIGSDFDIGKKRLYVSVGN